MIYGYIRISTKKQNLERQERNIKNYSSNVLIVKEIFTGTTTKRKEWEKLKKILKQNDIIIFDSVSRMSRNANEGIKEYNDLMKQGIKLIFLKEPYINTEVIQESIKQANEINLNSNDELIKATETYIKNILMIQANKQIKIAFEQSEKEVKDLQDRTRQGIITAKLHGKQIGQKKGIKLITKKSIETKEKIKKLSKNFSGNLKDIEIIKLLKISRNTFYKYKKELENNNI